MYVTRRGGGHGGARIESRSRENGSCLDGECLWEKIGIIPYRWQESFNPMSPGTSVKPFVGSVSWRDDYLLRMTRDTESETSKRLV